jgi:hypothetical protein
MTAGNYTYVWTPSYADIEWDTCEKRCSCCVKGECRPSEECGKIEDKVLIICGVLLICFILLGIGLCTYYNKVMAKRRKEHPEMFKHENEKSDPEAAWVDNERQKDMGNISNLHL